MTLENDIWAAFDIVARYDGAEHMYIDSIRDNRCGGLPDYAQPGCNTYILHTALNMYFVFLMEIRDYLGDGVEK